MDEREQILERLREKQRQSTHNVRPRIANDPALTQSVGQTHLGDEDFSKPLLRLDMSFSDLPSEKQKKFKTWYPEGDFVEKEGQYLARTAPDKPYSPYDMPPTEKFEPASDVADMLGDAIPMAFDVGTALLTGPAGWVRGAAKYGAANFAGDLAKEGTEWLRGTQDETTGEVLKGAATTGALGAVGSVAGDLVTGMANGVRGGGMLPVTPETREVLDFAQANDLESLMAFQHSDWALARLLGNQARQIDSTVNKKFKQQHESAFNLAEGQVDPSQLTNVWPDLKTQLERYTQETIDAINVPKTNMVEGGYALTGMLKQYRDKSQGAVRALYARAASLGDPSFDLSDLKAQAEELATPLKAAGKSGDEVEIGEPVNDTLAKLANQVLNLSDTMRSTARPSGKEFTPTDQLYAFRSALYDLKTPKPGESMRQEHFQASDLYNAVTRTLDNAQGASPEWKEAWEAARQAASTRFKTLDRALVAEGFQVAEGATRRTPEEFARLLTGRDQYSNIMFLDEISRQTGDHTYMEAFRNAVQGDLIERAGKGENIGKVLAGIDDKTLSALMTPDQKKNMLELSDNLSRLKNSGVQEALEQQTRDAALVQQLIGHKKSGHIDTMIGLIIGDASLRERFRIGVFQSIVDESTVVDKGARFIDDKKMSEAIDKYKANGADYLLSERDYNVLKGLRSYANQINMGADMGASLMAANAAAGILEADKKALKTYLRYRLLAKFMASEWGEKFLVGTGKGKLAPEMGRAIGAITANAAHGAARSGGTWGAEEQEGQGGMNALQKDSGGVNREMQNLFP